MHMSCSPRRLAVLVATAVGLATGIAAQTPPQPMGTAFTYQGELRQQGGPSNGSFDFRFRLYDQPTGGQILGTDPLPGVTVSKGLFTVEIDFGATPWNGDARWLDLRVKKTGDATFQQLEPRQKINPTPYALFAPNTGGGGGTGGGDTGGDTPWVRNGASIVYTEGNVGVGTTTPGSFLTVAGTIESTSGGVRFPDGSVQTTAATPPPPPPPPPTPHPWSLRGDVAFRSTGKVGVGTSTPRNSDRMTVAGWIGVSNAGEGLLGANGPELRTGANGNTWFVQPGSSTAHRFAVESWGARPGEADAEFAIDRLGRVGIRDFSPDADLDVKGVVHVGNHAADGTSSNFVELKVDPNPSLELKGTGTRPFIDFSNGGPTEDFDMRIFLSGENSLTIDGGRLGIGGLMTNPQYKLELPNRANPDGQGRANRWVEYSSVRWKENIREISSPLEKLRALRGVEFDWRAEFGGTRDLGFVAEEVGAVLPEIVSWEKDGSYAQGLAYSRILPVVIEAMKEQMTTIERQEARIEALKALVCLDHPDAPPCRQEAGR